jgi:hypothetical protein
LQNLQSENSQNLQKKYFAKNAKNNKIREKSVYSKLPYYRILASPKFFSAHGILPILPHSSKSPLLPFSVKFQNFHQPSPFWAASQAASSLS